MPVCGKVSSVSDLLNRPAVKNHRRSRTIGPPNVPSWILFSLSVRGAAPALDSSNGVRPVHVGFDQLSRKLPEKVFPPRRLTTLTTPPEKRPYSAEMPL